MSRQSGVALVQEHSIHQSRLSKLDQAIALLKDPAFRDLDLDTRRMIWDAVIQAARARQTLVAMA